MSAAHGRGRRRRAPHLGVEIKLRATGFEPRTAYPAYLETADGRRRPAGAFIGTGAFAVVDRTGRTVLAAILPTAAS